MNLLDARLERAGDGLEVVFGESRLPLTAATLARRPQLAERVDQLVTLGIRPEDFRTGAEARPGSDAVVTVTPTRVESLGSELVVYLDLGTTGSQHMTARLERSAAITDGEPVQLAVDLDRLYFFDAAGGDAIGA